MKIGSIVGAAFGGFWFCYAAFSMFPQYRSIDIAVSIVLAASFALGAVVRSPHDDSSARDDSAAGRKRRLFLVVLIAEIVALNVAWNVLLKVHREQYLVAAIAIVVGLHFIPLARIFRHRIYYIPAVAMTAAGVFAALTLWNALAALCCAIALWTAVSLRPSAVPV